MKNFFKINRALVAKTKLKLFSLALMALFATSVWADETYYLQNTSKASGSSPELTGDFYTAAPLTFSAGKEYDGTTYSKGLTFESNITGSSSNMKKPGAQVRYDCQTDDTEITVAIYNKKNSDVKFYYWTIQENATIGEECTVSEVTEQTATKEIVTTKTYQIKNSTRTSFYITVGDRSNEAVIQMKAVEKGTKFPEPGEAGYSINFNHGRYFGANGATEQLDKTSSITGVEMHMNNDYYYKNIANGKMQTKGTDYIKFAVATPMILNFTTSSTTQYNVSTTLGSEDNKITPIANTAKQIKLRTADTYYINPQGSAVTPTGMVFSAAPKVTYNANGGGSTMDQTYFTVAANGFTAPSGKKFKEWNTAANGKGTSYAVDDEIESDITLYAIWEQPYTVTYDANGGGETMTDSNSPYLAGDEVTLLANTFTAPDANSAWSAWSVTYTDGESVVHDVDVTDGKFTMPAYNVTVTAQWATAYDVKFFQGYGEPNAQIGETQSIGSGSYAEAPANPTRSGYEFLGWSYDATKAHIVNVAEYAISAATNFTAIWAEFLSISKASVTNGSITVSAESAIEGATITLTATPATNYLLGEWDVYKTGDESTKVSVSNNQFTMPAYAVTVSATFVTDTRPKILYVTKTSEADTKSNDKLYAALKDDYNIKIVAASSSETLTSYNLVILHESVDGSDYNANAVKAAKTSSVPVLNTKTYFYNSDRWNWGTPNAGGTVKGATLNSGAYCNVASHPIFEGVTISEGFFEITDEAAAKCMQPVSPASGKEGYTLATALNNGSGGTTAVQEIPAGGFRGASSGKYLLISVSSTKLNALNANGQKLFQNAAAYLLSNETWTPGTAPTSAAITASPSAAYTSGDNISLTASATGTAATTTYTWYKGDDLATAVAAGAIKAAATAAAGGNVYAKASCAVGDAGTYWCVITNEEGCDDNASLAITVAPTYAVTFNTAPDNGTLAVKKQVEEEWVAITSGDKFVEGTTLKVEASPAANYALDAIKVIKTGVEPEEDVTATVLEGTTLTVPAYAVTVSASFTYTGGGTDLDNTAEEVKAVKRIENGMLIIEKNGKCYNAQGQLVK